MLPAVQDAVIYIRVSTDQQAASGLGADAQEQTCRAYAARMGYTVRGVFRDEGVSGKVGMSGRTGLTAAVSALVPGTCLLVHSLSRFARSQRELWKLLDDPKNPIPLVSATEPFDLTTAMGRAFMGMLGVIAQLESDLASERTIAALEMARDSGVKLGAVPAENRDPGLAAVIRTLWEAGFQTSYALAEEMNRRGYPAPRGGRWHQNSMMRVIRRMGLVP